MCQWQEWSILTCDWENGDTTGENMDIAALDQFLFEGTRLWTS